MILNEEQNMLKDSAKDFCVKNLPISQLRRLRDENDPDGFCRDSWKSMVGLGWAAIPFPEKYGGLEFGYKGLGVVMEECGRTLAASPLFATVWLGGTALSIGGSEEQKAELLPQVASGDLLLALALEESNKHNPYEIAAFGEQHDGAFVIRGEKEFVLDGHIANKLIVVARTAGNAGDREGLTLFLVDADAEGLSIERTIMADSRNASFVRMNNVHVSSNGIVGKIHEGADILDPVLDIARIGLCAEMLGSMEECFDRTIAYLKEREQFGVPIGSFQALKHRAADMFCEVELSRSCVLEALTALDERRHPHEIATLASLCKTKVGETFQTVSREGIQMHGGIGMTDEFDIGFFIKRAAVAEQVLGDSDFHRDRYGQLEGY
tara:strand:+ start:1606 stop:2745 length:1140 start_codon:yes stop_codon:yes gene_type:complete